MIRVDESLRPADLRPAIERMWELSAEKIRALEKTWNPADGAPVFTLGGRYTARGWTEWTQGFQFGSAILQFDATGERAVPRARPRAHVRRGWRRTSRTSACTTTASTTSAPTASCGGSASRAATTPAGCERELLRAGAEGRAARCRRGAGRALPTAAATSTRSTARTRCSSTPCARCASLALAHRLGHALLGEGDRPSRCSSGSCQHARATARYSRLLRPRARRLRRARAGGAREHVQHRRRQLPLPEHPAGLLAVHHVDARAGLGDARLRRAARVPRDACATPSSSRSAAGREVEGCMLEAARATSRLLHRRRRRRRRPVLGHGRARARRDARGHRDRRPIPFNDHEPVDSSAAPIAAQGLLRLGRCSSGAARPRTAGCYFQAGLTIARTLLGAPYLSRGPAAPGPAPALRLPPARTAGTTCRPAARCRAASRAQWGDYHLRELALLRPAPRRGRPYYTFFGPRRRSVRRASPSSRAARGASGSGIARALAARRLRPGRRAAVRDEPKSRAVARRAARRRPRGPLLRAPTSASRRGRAALVDGSASGSAGCTCSSTTPASRRRVRADVLDAGGGELRRLAARQPPGPVLPDAGASRASCSSRGEPTRRGRARSCSSRRSRPGGLDEPRRLLRQQGRARDGRRSCGPCGSPSDGHPGLRGAAGDRRAPT